MLPNNCDWCRQCCEAGVPCLLSDLKNLKDKPELWWKWEKFCKYLDSDGRCSVYNLRPDICRLYATVNNEKMECKMWRYDKPDCYSTEFSKWCKQWGREWHPTL